jgi:hypothetical protein
MEATPGIEIQRKRLPQSRLASNSQSITQLELSRSRLSLAFPLSVHEVVPNPYQISIGLSSPTLQVMSALSNTLFVVDGKWVSV